MDGNKKDIRAENRSNVQLLNMTLIIILRRVPDNIERPALGFIVQAPDIFAQNTQRDQLHTAQE